MWVNPPYIEMKMLFGKDKTAILKHNDSPLCRNFTDFLIMSKPQN